jgi:hypothetical protein
MSGVGGDRGRVLIAGLLVAGAFGGLELALHHSALVEPDSVRMSYGIVHAIQSGEGLSARDLYGRAVSFGYYTLFLQAIQHFGIRLSALPAFMNALNMVCMSAAFIPITLWMSRLWGLGVAVLSASLLAIAPVIFELGGAGHPSGPAFFFLNTALAIFLVPGPRVRLWATALAACVLFVAATMRATVLLTAPLFPLLALARGRATPEDEVAERPVVMAIAGVAIGVLAGVGFFVLQSRVMALAPPRIVDLGDLAAGKLTAMSLLREHLRSASAATLAKGLVVSAIGIGPLIWALGWIGIAAAFVRRDWAFACAAFLLVLTNLALWAPHPTPSRHFHQTYLVLAPAAVLWLRSLAKPRYRVWAGAVLVGLNLLSMAAAYPVIASNYRFAFVKVLPRRTSTRVPMGDPYTNRVWVRRRIALEEAEARELAAAAEPRLLVFGSPVALRLIFQIASSSPSYRLDYERRFGAVLVDAKTPKTRYLIYEFTGGPNLPPAELMQRIAAAGELKDFAVAIVPVDRIVASEVIVPRGYRQFELEPLPVY